VVGAVQASNGDLEDLDGLGWWAEGASCPAVVAVIALRTREESEFVTARQLVRITISCLSTA